MKHLKYITILLIGIIFCGCTTDVKPKEIPIANKEISFDVELERFNSEFKIVVIDSCEYLYTDAGSSSKVVFHKGNCKFCIERNKEYNH